MADYNSSYTGVQIDTAVGKALTPDSTPTAESTELITSGAVKAAMDGKVPVYGMGENLLDNWYFLNPVNRRGQSSYSGAVQDTIDRWKTSNANTTISLTASGLVTSASGTSVAYLLQCLNHPNELLGKTVTLSFLTSTGLSTKTATLPASNPSATAEAFATIDNIGQILYLSGVWYVRLTSAAGSGNTYYAAKLELGTQQTLAHLEGSTRVLNEIPDYEEELIKCQTSTADSDDTYANKTLATEQQIAYVESGTTASRAYAVGEYFCWNGLLYRVISAISSGGTITPGANCEAVMGGGLNDLRSDIRSLQSKSQYVYSGSNTSVSISVPDWNSSVFSFMAFGRWSGHYYATYSIVIDTDGYCGLLAIANTVSTVGISSASFNTTTKMLTLNLTDAYCGVTINRI